ncbi:Putative epoxide hydrolase, alpha/Beta hydrolase [Colletotrichum destructivum]|uniref:Epoxide hydrolase, alpha/Beta hydrolase n=1 Tax=Colletotrichum destructivum TaxID=34406 RepID=A0AAX4IA10_9PEZI|nr:Putative epoxide hydrolase, alpha/Beta hydrolase [Colletotrichum destructivum]
MATPLESSAILSGDEIKPYRIHVSSKYLDLTKQKLELTRLPHETVESKSRDWWEPKTQIEPLIDFWLERYDWREQEAMFNDQLPQFRTAVTVPGSDSSVRLHFIHVRSPHEHAVPLLLLPPFPFTNLSLRHLIQPLAQPQDPDGQQPFHVVVPSLPGLGFSDALPGNTPVIPATAGILDLVMARLSYTGYLVSNTSSAASSPAEIDWKLANRLVTYHPGTCLGAHFINPSLKAPSLKEAPLEWMKWSLAKFFRAPILGYQSEDIRSLDRTEHARQCESAPAVEPNTPSYALCDSPVGLLALVLRVLRVLGTRKEFSAAEIITFTQTAWLPGPEAAMRFWAHCLTQREEEEPPSGLGKKPTVAITVFSASGDTGAAGAGARGALPHATPTHHVCPAWANVSYDTAYVRRVAGSPGLVAWDRPELIGEGVRGLTRRLLSPEGRLKGSGQPSTAPLRGVVVDPPDAPPSAGGQRSKLQSPRTAAAPSTPQIEAATWRLERIREASETPKKTARQGEHEGETPDPDFDGASPDTIVVTPPPNEGLR